MSITHHPDPATLMSYAGGGLAEPIAAVVACHVAVCRTCRKELSWLEQAGADLLAGIDGVTMIASGPRHPAAAAAPPSPARSTPASAVPPGPRETILTDVPAPLIRFVGPRLDRIDWKYLAPGVRHVPLPLSPGAKGDLRLIKVAAGQRMPDHGHGGQEMTMLLAGAYTDEVGRFTTGDVADLDEDVEHQPVADPVDGCICLIASVKPARYKGLFARLVQPFIGI